MATENSITNFIRIPDIISLGNGIAGLISIIFSSSNRPDLAFLFIAIAGVLDFFDGRIARRMGITSEFGKQLDSLCDICSFIVAPAVFLFHIESIPVYIRIVTMIAYLLAGLLRLARFNITGTTDNGKYFEGMPVPFSIVVVGAFFLFQISGLPLLIWLGLYLAHALLMVSTVRIRKL